MTDRRRLLDLPGGPVIADGWVQTGYQEAIPLVDAYLGIDTDAMKLTALNLYGIPAQHDNTGQTGDVDSVDANLEVEGGGQLYTQLQRLAFSVEGDFGDKIKRWSGPAFDAAQARRNALRSVVSTEANNARRIGQGLWHFADTLEKDKSDIKDAVKGGASLALSVEGFLSAADKFHKALSVLGIILDLADNARKEHEKLQQDLREVAESNEQLAQLIDPRDPTRTIRKKVSLDTHDWEVE